jgi:hypothetical protein
MFMLFKTNILSFMKTKKLYITEISFYVFAISGAILSAYVSNWQLLIKLVTVFPLLLFYVYAYRYIYGDISVRKYIGLKISSIFLFIAMFSIFNINYFALKYSMYLSVSAMVICSLFDIYKYIYNKDMFYIKHVIRQLIVITITFVSYLVV